MKVWKKSQHSLRDFPGGPVVDASPPNAGGTDSLPGWGAKMPHASQPEYQNMKQEQSCDKFSEDFKKHIKFTYWQHIPWPRTQKQPKTQGNKTKLLTTCIALVPEAEGKSLQVFNTVLFQHYASRLEALVWS